MKKIKLLALAFVIGTTSTFATNVYSENCLDSKKPLVKETSSNSTQTKQQVEINSSLFFRKHKAKKRSSATITKNDKVLDLLNLKSIEKQKKLKQIINYYETMPEIISKE